MHLPLLSRLDADAPHDRGPDFCIQQVIQPTQLATETPSYAMPFRMEAGVVSEGLLRRIPGGGSGSRD